MFVGSALDAPPAEGEGDTACKTGAASHDRRETIVMIVPTASQSEATGAKMRSLRVGDAGGGELRLRDLPGER